MLPTELMFISDSCCDPLLAKAEEAKVKGDSRDATDILSGLFLPILIYVDII